MLFTSNHLLYGVDQMGKTADRVAVRYMEKGDLDEVLRIERSSFPAPWTETAFLSELENKYAHYFVLLLEGRIIGYAGMWMFAGESHVTTVAVAPEYRSCGYGRMLMNLLIDYSREHGVDTMVLEVRVSNIPAIKLYSSLGFRKIGIRRNYYAETREDAYVMLLQLRGWENREEDDQVDYQGGS